MQQKVISYGGNRFVLAYDNDKQVVQVDHIGKESNKVIGEVRLDSHISYGVFFASGGVCRAVTLREGIDMLCYRFLSQLWNMDKDRLDAEFRAIADTI